MFKSIYKTEAVFFWALGLIQAGSSGQGPEQIDTTPAIRLLGELKMNATITERQVKTYFSLLGSRPNVAPPERMHFFFSSVFPWDLSGLLPCLGLPLGCQPLKDMRHMALILRPRFLVRYLIYPVSLISSC